MPECTSDTPLIVDLDGTLIRTDLLVETALEYLGRQPVRGIGVMGWLVRGKARLKGKLAERSRLDIAALPYDKTVLDYVLAARQGGRKVYIASASHALLVGQIAEHLGCFDGWYASDEATNLAREQKADFLTATFGEKSFDYIGNEAADLPVWRRARRAILANAPSRISRRLTAESLAHEILSSRQHKLTDWVRLLRPHQWIKNILVFVPILTAHMFTVVALTQALIAFVALSLCASGVYILNDLVDIQADRQHPRKRLRPFASGAVPAAGGALLAPLLIGLSFVVASFLSRGFFLILGLYFLITSAYSLFLKRKLLLDAVVLSSLYSLRVIAGAQAIQVVMSEWLLAFSLFLFFALALIKRHSELALRFDAGLPDPSNRDYRVEDLNVVAALAAAAGFNAVIVISLYISSGTVQQLYRHPQYLWLACPLFFYWIARLIILSNRRVLHDDPVVFAMRDPVSIAVAALVLFIGFFAAL